MKAVRVDVETATGVTWTRDVQLVEPGDPVPVETVTPGGAYYLGGLPLVVHSVADDGRGWTTLTLGDGTYDAPRMRIPTGATISPAIPVPVLDAAAAYAVAEPDPADPALPPVESTVEIPSTFVDNVVTLTLDVPPAVGAYSWDLYVRTTEHDWQRIVEGTLTVVAGDAR